MKAGSGNLGNMMRLIHTSSSPIRPDDRPSYVMNVETVVVMHWETYVMLHHVSRQFDEVGTQLTTCQTKFIDDE